MPLPDHLERLRHISIDTLGLSQSTQAVLKWYGITSVLDCIGRLYITVNFRRNSDPWTRLMTLLIGEVRLKLIAAGCWDLMLEADTWRVLGKRAYSLNTRRIVHWQGRDQDLYEIPLESLGGLDGLPDYVSHRFKSIGATIDFFLTILRATPRHWLKIYKDPPRPAKTFFGTADYMFWMVQPRLVELGYWRFVEEYIDDVEGRWEGAFVWEDEGEET